MSDLKAERDALRDAVVDWSVEAAELKREVERLEARVAALEAAQVTTVFVVLPHLDYEGYGAPLSAHTTREAAWLAAAAVKKQGSDKYTKYEVEEVALAAEKGEAT